MNTLLSSGVHGVLRAPYFENTHFTYLLLQIQSAPSGIPVLADRQHTQKWTQTKRVIYLINIQIWSIFSNRVDWRFSSVSKLRTDCTNLVNTIRTPFKLYKWWNSLEIKLWFDLHQEVLLLSYQTIRGIGNDAIKISNLCAIQFQLKSFKFSNL